MTRWTHHRPAGGLLGSYGGRSNEWCKELDGLVEVTVDSVRCEYGLGSDPSLFTRWLRGTCIRAQLEAHGGQRWVGRI